MNDICRCGGGFIAQTKEIEVNVTDFIAGKKEISKVKKVKNY